MSSSICWWFDLLVALTRKWTVILLVCILVPVAFFAAWEISGISQAATETVNLEPVAWEFPHPTGDLIINGWQNASFEDNVCSLAFSVAIGGYYSYPPAYLDFAGIVDISGKSPLFYVKTASVSIGNLTGSYSAEVDPTVVSFNNLSVAGYGTASASFVGNSNSKSAYLSQSGFWYPNPEANATCGAAVVVEVVYFNGTMFRQVIQPFDLILKGGQHVFEINTVLGNFEGEGQPGNAPVWVNGTEYASTPVTIFGLDGDCYTVSCNSTIWYNSTKYTFEIWENINAGNICSENPATINLTSDLNITAFYSSTEP
jgi:hypothetical protein